MKYSLTAVILGLMVAFSTQQSAAQSADVQKFQQFTRSKEYGAVLNNAFSKLPPAVFTRCPTLVSNGSKVTILRPVTFAQDGWPNAGAWRQSFPVSGCGNDTTLNFVFVATAEEKINTIAEHPGDTIASPVLQRDSMLQVTTGLALLAKGCKETPLVIDTHFRGFTDDKGASVPQPKPDDRPQLWHETWTVKECGRTFDVPIRFYQTKEVPGTTIAVSSSDIK